MGRVHAGVYAALSNVEIAGIVSRSSEGSGRLAAQVGALSIADPWLLLDDDSVDAIDITYPSGLHREWAVAALERGKHVFVETPMALTVEDADAMIAAARQSQKILMPAQVQRFGIESAFIHDEVASGALGRPVAAYTGSRLPFYGSGERRPVDLYGGRMLDLMIHPFDWLNWILGTPLALSGAGRIGPSGSIDYAFVAVEFEHASGMAEGSAMMPHSFPLMISQRVLCEEGALEASVILGPNESFSLVRYPSEGEPQEISLEGGDPYTRECMYFLACIQGEADPTVVSAQGERDALRVALAAQQAIEHRARVDLT